jgi:hypothetical protein
MIAHEWVAILSQRLRCFLPSWLKPYGAGVQHQNVLYAAHMECSA